jgi:hypothetical protein
MSDGAGDDIEEPVRSMFTGPADCIKMSKKEGGQRLF